MAPTAVALMVVVLAAAQAFSSPRAAASRPALRPGAPPSAAAAAEEAALFLCDDHVDVALAELRAEYDAVFYQNPALKMSGDVRLASIEGCDVRLRLVGMFWHSRRVVFDLASHWLRRRIPEIADVLPHSDANLDDARTRSPDLNGDRHEIARLGHEEYDAVVIRHRPGLTFTGYNMY